MLGVLFLAGVVGSGAPDGELREGRRVRIFVTEDAAATASQTGQPLVGRVLSTGGDSVALETGGTRLAIPLKDIIRLEVNYRGRNLKRGALIGGLVGFATLTALCIAYFNSDDDFAISTADSFAIGAVLGAPAGGAVGLGIGALAPAWHEIPAPSSRTRSRAVALSLAIRF